MVSGFSSALVIQVLLGFFFFSLNLFSFYQVNVRQTPTVCDGHVRRLIYNNVFRFSNCVKTSSILVIAMHFI